MPPTEAAACVAAGDGLKAATTRKLATFTIEAGFVGGGTPPTRQRQQDGGDTFVVLLRGRGERVRPRIVDNGNGQYTVAFKPYVSGKLAIAIAFGGQPIPGSPFTCHVGTPTASAPHCMVRGAALTSAIARRQESFELSFCDSGGNVAHAEDIDVYVVPAGSMMGQEQGTSQALPLAQRPESAPVGRVRDTGYGNKQSRQDAFLDGPLLLRTAECMVTSRKPLVLRAGIELDSARVGQLHPGQRLVILRVVSGTEDGERSVRALVALAADDVSSLAASPRLFDHDWRQVSRPTLICATRGRSHVCCPSSAVVSPQTGRLLTHICWPVHARGAAYVGSVRGASCGA